MTLTYDETPLHEAATQLHQQHQYLEQAKPLLTKITNSVRFITSKDSVKKSTLTKHEVKELIDLYDKNELTVKSIEERKRKFEQGVNRAYLQQKEALENQLKSLKREAEEANRRFPSGNSSVIGYGPYEHLKEAYKEMD